MEVRLPVRNCEKKKKILNQDKDLSLLINAKKRSAFYMKSLLTIIVILCCLNGHAQDKRSDSVDITHIKINLDMTRSITGQNQIAGYASIKLKAVNFAISYVYFDLLKMTIDSIVQNTARLNYNYNDSIIYINLFKSLVSTDTEEVKIYYHGQPQGDPTGWGGFYFATPYVYNLGVGFGMDPHVYGRCWFPCFDNFVERQLFSFNIKTDSIDQAICNGILISNSLNADATINWQWQLGQQIPTYLANVSVAPYRPAKNNFNSISGKNIPVWLAALPVDTANAIKSFANLNNCLKAFEKNYGPYLFDRVGYCMVPFNSGAMEHAGNISYPLYASDGTKTYETLWAHELAHQWWGNQTTCKNEGDMWLNEGWACYNEAIFLENIYGRESYRKRVSDNHTLVLQKAHINDDGYRAVAGMPHDYTYGTTVYKKGADVVHSLRGYMGDKDFFEACLDFQNTYKFNSVGSDDLKNIFQNHTKQSMNSFFDNWVYEKGFPHFEISNLQIDSSNTLYSISGTILQRLLATQKLYDSVPMDFTAIGPNLEKYTAQAIIGGYYSHFQIKNIPFKPVIVCQDLYEKISDAITDEYYIIDSVQTYKYTNARLNLNVKSVSKNDSNWVRVEHHWIGANGAAKTPGLYISPTHYWTIQTIVGTTFDADASLNYSGAKDASGVPGLDSNLFYKTEDSLVLLYRENTDSTWVEYIDYIKNMGSKTDLKGNVLIKHIKSGDYTFGAYNTRLSIPPVKKNDEHYIKNFYPNPSNGNAHIELKEGNIKGNFTLYDMKGGLLQTIPMRAGNLLYEISVQTKGIYIIKLEAENGQVLETVKWVVE